MEAIESTTTLLQHLQQDKSDLVEIVVEQEPSKPQEPTPQAPAVTHLKLEEKPIDVIMKDDVGESHIGTFRVTTSKCPKRLFEIASHRRLASTRLILYQIDTLVASLLGTFSSFPPYMQSVLRLGVSLSNVFLFSLVDKIPTEDDEILVAFTEFTNNEDEIALDLYQTSLREINAKSAAYIQEEKQIDPDNEAPVQYKPTFVVDLDQTLLLSDEDAKRNAEKKRKAESEKMDGDFEMKMSEDLLIGGPMAIINKNFFNKIKIREGAYEFLAELVKISGGQVYILTAADIHYARAAVGQANEKYWITDSPYENKPDKSSDKFEPVHIPITHVFSTRHQEKRALPKTFERVIPYWSFLKRQQQTYPSTIRVFGIDDDITAWDENCRRKVFQVPPCKPGYNDPSELLFILEQIKKQL
jgi:hypothetical protein